MKRDAIQLVRSIYKANKAKENIDSKIKTTEMLTSVIKHWGLSDYTSIQPRIKFSVTRQESSPQSPTFHTADRYASG